MGVSGTGTQIVVVPLRQRRTERFGERRCGVISSAIVLFDAS
jgi:hypothetical protein